MLNARPTHKRLCIALLASFVLLFIVTSPVLAYLYRATFTVAESNGTDYTALAVTCLEDVDWLIDNGFITLSTALDTRVETFGGSEQIHMVAEDRIMAFASPLDGNSQINWYLTTGNTELSSFPVIAGDGGYITTSDAAALELGDDFEIEFDGWIDTSTSNPDSVSFPVVEGTATSSYTSRTTSHAVSLPGGIQAGDLLIMVFQHSDDDDTPTVTWPPSGWTSLAHKGDGSPNVLCIGYKVASGSEGPTVTVTSDGGGGASAHQTFRISSYTGTPELSCDTGVTSDDEPNPPSLTPSWGAQPVLWIAGCGIRESWVSGITVSSYPTDYDNGLWILSDVIEGENKAAVGTARRLLFASSENPGIFTMSESTQWRGFTIAVQGIPVPTDSFVQKAGVFYIYPDSGTVRAGILHPTLSKTVTASGLGSGAYTIKVWADGADFGIDVDEVPEDSVALGGTTVPDGSNDWIISIPYFDYYEHTISSTLIVDYEPVTLIVGTALPDKEGAAQDGTITWGSNPAGVTVTLGSLTAESAGVTIEDEGDEYRETMHEAEVSDWFLEPDIGVTLAAHPLRPLVTIMSNGTTVTEVQAWRFLGLALLLLLTVSAAVLVRGHLLIAGLVCGGTIALLAQQTIWPGWSLVFIIPAIVAGLIAERTPSVG